MNHESDRVRAVRQYAVLILMRFSPVLPLNRRPPPCRTCLGKGSCSRIPMRSTLEYKSEMSSKDSSVAAT